MKLVDAIDWVVSVVSPKAGLTRRRHRVAETLLRKYDAASTTVRNKHWYSPSTDAESELSTGIEVMRNRSRELVRNAAYAANAVRLIAGQTVGSGILPRPTFKRKSMDDLVTREWGRFVEESYADGPDGFYGIQRLVMRCVVESGEALVVQVRRPGQTGFQLRVLEPDYIDMQRGSTTPSVDGSVTHNGIEYDAAGKIAAYWLFDRHPGSDVAWVGGVESKRVSAEYVLRVFRRDRPGQQHGVPWLHPVVVPIKSLSDASDASLIALKMSACLTGVVTGMESGPLLPSETDSTVGRVESIRPGAMVYLQPGQDVKFSSPPSFSQNVEFQNAILREISSGTGIPYELLTGDYSKSSFSASRMAMLPFRRWIDECRTLMLIPMLCRPVWNWFMQDLVLRGVIGPNVRADFVAWTPPTWEAIDPKSEAEANVLNVRNGFVDWSSVVSRCGGDPEARYAEIAKFNESLDANGITLDCDPRKDRPVVAAPNDAQANQGGNNE